jgi:hypothetical protein
MYSEKVLNNIKHHKACGQDKIKPIVLNTLSKELSPILEVIFQKFIDELRLVAIPMEICLCSPNFQERRQVVPANDRPISLTCVLCKVMGHIVSTSIVIHFTNHNILYHLQHGFKEKRSCVTQLVMLINDLATSVYEKKQVDLILLDFSKAFSHEKVLLKIT